MAETDAQISQSLNSIRKAQKDLANGLAIPIHVHILDECIPEELSSRQSGYVYVLWHVCSDGKRIPYIGETGTTLAERKASHIYQARSRLRKGESVNPDGLYYAMLIDMKNGLNPEETFQIESLLEIKGSAKERKEAEAKIYREWVKTYPRLYNLAADGGYHSGGMGNRISCVLAIGEDEFEYISISALMRDMAEALKLPLEKFSSRTRQRLLMGWSYPEAFGLIPRVDGRRTKASIARKEATEKTGLSTVAQKSMDVRAARRARRTVNSIIENLFRPGMPDHKMLMAKANANKVPKATRINRLDQIRRGLVAATSAADVIEYCARPSEDRRQLVTITLPNGITYTKGVNEWAKCVNALARMFPKKRVLSFSGAKRRFKEVLQVENPTNEDLLFAIGLKEKENNRVGAEHLGIKLTRRHRFDGKPHAK